MAEELSDSVAVELASSLKSIPGFPWDPENIKANAEDLQDWCRGGFLDNVLWQPEPQARWLVKEARLNWERWNGTAALRQLFQSKFERKKLHPEQEAFDAKKWEAEHGPPDPNWASNLFKIATTGNKHKDFLNTLKAVKYQSIRDSLYYTEGQGRFTMELEHGDSAKVKTTKRFDQSFWREAMDGHNKKNPELVAFFRSAIATGQLDAVPPDPNFDFYLPDKPHSLTHEEYLALSPPIPETPAVRCATCGGSGRLAGDDYCTCRMGRDLYRVENGDYR